jgi:hypothetical protein
MDRNIVMFTVRTPWVHNGAGQCGDGRVAADDQRFSSLPVDTAGVQVQYPANVAELQ